MLQFRDLRRQYEAIKSNIDNEISSVIESTSFISGEQVRTLEKALGSYVGVKHCISVANGTDAITIALRALVDTMPLEDRKKAAVFVPDFTFFSSGECPADLGLATFFVDVKESTYNIDPESLKKSIIAAEEKGYKPTIVIAVDLFGQPAEYPALRSIAEKNGMYILEDGAQGFGGRIGAQMSCSFGDISTTSFFPAKPLGCYGDGGAIFTDNDEWADLCRSLAVHGKDTSNLSDPMAKYNNVRLGYNSRLDTIQAGVLLAKFPVFRDSELENVNKAAGWYNEMLTDINGITIPKVLDGYYSSWAQYTIQLPEGVDREKIQNKMSESGIPTMVYYKKPMHLQEAFEGKVGSRSECPVTERLCEKVLCLPIHPYLEKDEVGMICREVGKVIDFALKII